MGLPARIWGPALVAAGPATVFTAAANERVRNLIVWVSNPSGSPVSFIMSIGADAAATRVVSISIPAGTLLPFGPFVVHASEIVQLSAGTAATLNASGHGDKVLVS